MSNIFDDNKEAQSGQAMPFGPKNYKLALLGVLLIIGGFILMALDSTEFGFGLLGLTVGPVTVLAGFAVNFFAILKKS